MTNQSRETIERQLQAARAKLAVAKTERERDSLRLRIIELEKKLDKK